MLFILKYTNHLTLSFPYQPDDDLCFRFGLHSRLWVQSAFLTLATPFAALTIYLEPPYCFIALGSSRHRDKCDGPLVKFYLEN